jgi:cysteinyl-tRNA synthetase
VPHLLPRSIYESKAAFHAALCDSFNTPEAVDILRELVSRVNLYINTRGPNVNVSVAEYAARWIGKMLRMFGLGEGENEDIGWGHEQDAGGNVDVGASLEFRLPSSTLL